MMEPTTTIVGSISRKSRLAHNRTVPELEQAVVADYVSGKSTQRIATERSMKQATVFNIVKRSGIKLRKRADYRTYWFDESYFEHIDSHEKACILGFLYADGCVYTRRSEYLLAVGLSAVDREHLRWIADCMKFTGPIIEHPDHTTSLGGGPSVDLRIGSKKLFYDLLRLGMHRRKSLTLRFPTPEQVPNEFLNSFLLGYFEGDGWIYEASGRQDANIGIVSTLEFTTAVQIILKERLDVNSTLSLHLYGKNVHTLKIAGARQVIRTMEWLYRDCLHKMPRKHEIFQRFRVRYDVNARFIETEEWKRRRHERLVAARKKHLKPFCAKSPDGVIYHARGQQMFSSEFGLRPNSLYRVLHGQRKSHHGWTRPTDLEIASARAAGTLIERLYRTPTASAIPIVTTDSLAPIEALPTNPAFTQAVA